MAGDYRGNYIRSSDHAFSVEEDTTSSMYSSGKECMPTEWTDEKHSLYLKSVEASFVDQLYSSLGSNLSKENVGGKPSDEQMNVRQPEYRLKGRHGGGSPHEFLRSPWINHYKSLPKNQVVSSKGLVICSSGSASDLRNMLREGCSHLHDRDQISIGEEEEEVSDQNFVNEVTKGENGSSKKMKTVIERIIEY
ncbi:cold-regulated protein 27 isoform X4 [Brassica napus]|uniref:cold-regulated protein 27 isoform X4 n=1 Tax=Brassica napus TaxID=3708 RepID=UPI0006AABF92|nr:cold-regulated protein 27 isoform X4 [Brassica napus]